MPQYQAVSRNVHANKRWRRYDSYRFAAADTVATLVARELPRAMMHLPIAFVARGERFSPAAVQGLQPGKNLFVAPDGRWIGGYTPAAYRGYPFALAETPDGKRVLAFDADSGLLSESDGEAFFDEEGNPSATLKGILDFLNEVHANREATDRICAALQQHGLIQPWPVTVAEDEARRSLDGLYRIDEAALNALPAADFEALRQAGALPVVYCQLLSMQHFAMLGKLAHAHQQAARPLPQTPTGDLDLEFLNASDTIGFGGL